MASTSSSPIDYKYDVFLSFRGDTRFAFTDHLYKALTQAGIRTFRDVDEIHPGQELKPGLESSIRQSTASIVVISESYATSRWCLEELWLILQQKKYRDHFVLPVFYKVDPSDVRNQRGSFKIEAKEGSKWTAGNVNRWKAALTEVADVIGMNASGYETSLISDIVQKIYHELGLKLRSVPTDLTGIERRAEGINPWLKNEQAGSPVLAICGMGGAGKTTLAKYVYSSNKQNFDRCSLLEDIGKQPGGLLGVQKQLLKDISGNNSLTISDVYEGAWHVENALRMSRVLIVVDDVDDKEQLTTLFGTKVFPTRSKIIITTRLLDLNAWYGSISSGCHVLELELLNDDESLELLSWHAFGSKIPVEGFEDLAVQLAKYCGGNPLALKVLASSLSFSGDDKCTRNKMIEIWRSEMNSLDSMKGDVNCKIQVVLRRSFESLPRDINKELFLHIACFFIGDALYWVEEVLEDDWYAKSGILTLVNRCLLTISSLGELKMHNLLQDLAYKIVGEESKDLTKRSRVWHHKESYLLLRKGDGSETIEGLKLSMQQGTGSDQPFNTSSLVKMRNLKLLELQDVKLTGSYQNFPYLRLLRWFGCNLKTIPPGLLMSSLVAISMTYSNLEKFELPEDILSLKFLDLSYSFKLVSIHSLYRLPKLKKLSLVDCTSLTHICKSIGDLTNLASLSFSGCTNLWNASLNEKIANPLERLKALFFWRGIPEEPLFSLPQSLSFLNLAANTFDVLPNFIDFSLLKVLVLISCPNLKSLPRLPTTLQRLHVDWCTSLENITFQSSRFTLHVFTYEGCFKLAEIEGLFKLVPVAKLDEVDLGHHMQWIKSYQDHKVDLVGDVITKGRTFNIQMLYEYGIRSVYLQCIKDESMATHEHTTSSNFLSFCVPLHPKKQRIQGLNVTCLYRSSGVECSRDTWPPPILKIHNISKGVTWVYVPVVYGEPRVDEDVVWLSNWPIGNTLEGGDEVNVVIYLRKEWMTGRGCGASVVYMDDEDDGEVVEKEEIRMNEEVIGGDLSEFEVAKGAYYLCRRDLFSSRTSDALKWFFGEHSSLSLSTDSRTWRTSGHIRPLWDLHTSENPNHKRWEVVLGVSFSSESDTDKIEKALYSVEGVESVFTQKEIGRLSVTGRVNPQAVAACVREFESMVQIIDWKHPQ